MESRAKLLGHPVHQMLVPFPFGLLGMAVIFDVLSLIFQTPTWSTVSYWMIAAGLVSGVIAAPFGVMDWLSIPSRTRAKRIGAIHGVGNLFVLVLFFTSWTRRGTGIAYNDAYALVLSFVGLGIALVTGWLGGELVDRLGIGVDPGANLDAPNSLSTRRAA
jgi:uncharacterized membrane protein